MPSSQSPSESAAPKPTLGLLRSLTDEHVLNALLERRRLTRAEVAARTGISKPTVAESVRRLAAAGLVRDTGERSTGRGRAGSYFALAADLGWALAINVTASSIEAERVDLLGQVIERRVEPIPDTTDPTRVAEALVRAAEQVSAGVEPARLATISAADPVDRHSGRLVELPDSPFLVGALDPAAALADLVTGSISVDNDVNWAARAKLAEPGCPADFVLLYLGEGLGCAVVSDGSVRRGHTGLAGEVAHLITSGPGGRAMHFTDVFARLGLHRPGTSAIRVGALSEELTKPGGPVSADVADAVCGVLVTMISIMDPEMIMIAGPWGEHATLIAAVTQRLRQQPRQTPLHPAGLATDAPLAAAREQGRRSLQRELLARIRS